MEVVIDKAELRSMSRAERHELAVLLAELDERRWHYRARSRRGSPPTPANPSPGRASTSRSAPTRSDRPGAAPGTAAGAAGLGRLLRGPGRLDRGARRHPAAPLRRASLAGRLGELRRVPARGVRGDGLGDLAAAAGPDPAAGARRRPCSAATPGSTSARRWRRAASGSACCPRSSPSCRSPSWPSPGRGACSGPRSPPGSWPVPGPGRPGAAPGPQAGPEALDWARAGNWGRTCAGQSLRRAPLAGPGLDEALPRSRAERQADRARR